MIMPGVVYPLTLDQRILQRDLFYQDASTLSQTLDQIRTTCNTQCNTSLSECSEHLTATIEAYRAYYLNPGPGRWHSDLHAYREELRAMFDGESSFTMEEIHTRAAREFRQYTKQDLCTPNPSDLPPIANNKLTTAHTLDDGTPIDDCVNQYLNTLSQLSPNEETARFLYDLQTATTPEARTPLYIRHYCTPSYTDSPKLAHFKSKYARQFQAGASHDTVIAIMKAEAEGSKSADVSGLRIRLGELQMAQSAHLKSVARKAEKDQKMRDASPVVKTEPEMVGCAYAGCERKTVLDDEDFGGPVECALCDWLAQQTMEGEGRTFYCSKEHAEMDFTSHDRQHHTCVSGPACYYFPFPPPQDGHMAGGLCPDCISQNHVSYFCSQFCFKKNVSTHRASANCGDGFDYRATLVTFEPTPEMVLEA